MPVPVIDIAQMRAWEQATWAGGQTEAEVIRQAGAAVATVVRRIARPGQRILVLAGKGHNGDDARQAALHLSARRVDRLDVVDPDRAVTELDARLGTRPHLVIDGLFGIGLSRPLEGAWLGIIDRLNRSGLPVLAVDVPSGLDADLGQPLGDAVRAAITVTLGAPKRGLLAASAWRFVGRLEVAPNIGLIPNPHASDLQWTLPGDFALYPPVRRVDGHKGTFGHLAIVAGSRGYHGAAVLATRAALQAQPGLVTLVTPPDVYVPVASQCQAAMVHPWEPGFRLPETASAILAGPGLAAPALDGSLRDWIRELWAGTPLPMIVDASALDWLPAGPVATSALRLITPHPGEAARQLGLAADRVQTDRPAAVRALSVRLGGASVVLKGWQSLVGAATGPIWVNPSGNPYLAQGGSGDLLAGFLGGLLAQPRLQRDPLTAIRYAVWQHGATADRLQATRRAWTVGDLAGRLGEELPEDD